MPNRSRAFGPPSLGLGTFPLSGVFSSVTQDTAVEIVSAFVYAGGEYIETAPVYAPNNIDLGSILKTMPRENLFISTKCVTGKTPEGLTVRSGKAAHLRAQCLAELERLGLDYLDLFQLHIVPEDATPHESIGELQALQAEGLIVNIGVSNVTLPQLMEFAEIGPIDYVQNRLSYIHRGTYLPIRDFCVRNNIRLNPYQAIERGLLSDHSQNDFPETDLRSSKYEYRGDVYQFCRNWVHTNLGPLALQTGLPVSHLAIAWTLAQPAVGIIPLGATSAAQVVDNMSAPGRLSEAILAEMETLYLGLENNIRQRFGLSVDEYRGL